MHLIFWLLQNMITKEELKLEAAVMQRFGCQLPLDFTEEEEAKKGCASDCVFFLTWFHLVLQ